MIADVTKTAVIQEGIRLHPGASIRQERVAPNEDLFYEDKKSGLKYMIPKGVCSSRSFHPETPIPYHSA